MPMYPRRTFRSVASTGCRSSARWRRRKASRSSVAGKDRASRRRRASSAWVRRGLSSRSKASDQRHGVLLTGEQLVHRDGSAPGHDGLRVLRPDDILFPQVQPLREHPHQRGVEGQGAALEDDGGRQLQSLGQAADGLLGDGVEGGQGDVGPLRPLDQQGLDVRLGEHAAPTGDAVDGLPLGGQLLELVRRHIQQGGDLVDERAGAAGAAAVHPHVGGLELSGGLVIVEEDHLGVLSAQLHGGADLGVQGPDGGGVGHHLLDVAGPQSGGDGPPAGAADPDAEPGKRETARPLPPEAAGRWPPDGRCAADTG